MAKVHESGAVGFRELAEELGGHHSQYRALVALGKIPFFIEGKKTYLHPKDVLAVIEKEGIKMPGLRTAADREMERAVEHIRNKVLDKAAEAAIAAMKEEIRDATDEESSPPLLAALHRELADMIDAQAEQRT